MSIGDQGVYLSCGVFVNIHLNPDDIPVRMSALTNVGIMTKRNPASCIAAPPSTATMAVPPPGGCMQRQTCMAPRDRPTARPAATVRSATSCETTTPIVADSKCPPRMDQGRAAGLSGNWNTITAAAPILAITAGPPAGINRPVSSPITAMDVPAKRATRADLTVGNLRRVAHWLRLCESISRSLR